MENTFIVSDSPDFCEQVLIPINVVNDHELGGVVEDNDDDLLKIKCFGTHEGVNENGTEFTREVLAESYKTFIDKPVVIVPDARDFPTGHGYDFNKQTYHEEKRKFIGHIVDAYPCIVTEDGEIVLVNDGLDDLPVGEYRIICELVVYKKYFPSFSKNIKRLHLFENLNFSMESIINGYIDPNGIKHCSKICFTGLCLVKRPAFEHSTSLEVAEKEDNTMDFEKLYEEANAKIETLITEKTTIENDYETVVREKELLTTEVVTAKEELASATATIADLKSEIEELGKYKEQVENAEKLQVGENRLAKLSKFGEVEKSAEELAEITSEEYVEMLTEMAENYSPANANDGIATVPVFERTKNSGKARLLEILTEIC